MLGREVREKPPWKQILITLGSGAVLAASSYYGGLFFLFRGWQIVAVFMFAVFIAGVGVVAFGFIWFLLWLAKSITRKIEGGLS